MKKSRFKYLSFIICALFVFILTQIIQPQVILAQTASVGIKEQSSTSTIGVTYSSHVQNIGWQGPASDGGESGTDGKGLRLEALKINLTGTLPIGAGITYQTQVQNVGWQNYVSDGIEAGTNGRGLREEAIRIKLVNIPGYSVQYRVHVQNVGWQDWVSDGVLAGTVGRSLRLEALEVRILSNTVHPTTLNINKTTDSVIVGGTDTLTSTINPTNSTNKAVTWTSSDNSIITVDNAGKVTGITTGTATISVTTVDGNKIATCIVTINNPIAIDPTKYDLDITGLKDTSVPFQKMIDSFPSGSSISLPKGIYKFDNTVDMKDGITLVASKDAVIIGTGTNTLFNAGNSDTFNGINFEECSTAIKAFEKKSVNVLNSSFGNNISYAAINYYGVSSSLVKLCSFYDIRKYGVLIDDDSCDITIDTNNFNNSIKYGGYTTPQIGGHVYCLNGTRITVSNNVLNNSGGQGVIFGYNSTTGKGTTNSVAINNSCQGNGQEGATIYGGSNKVTSGNSIINNNCTNNRFNQIEVWQADNCIVKNNIVSETVDGIGNLGAICLFATTGTICTENNVLSAQSNGIDITAGSLDCIVSDNNIADTNRKSDINTPEQGNGILLDSNTITQPQYITITNNTIIKSNGIINKSGIYSTSNTNHHNTISGNIITGYQYGVNYYAEMTCGI